MDKKDVPACVTASAGMCVFVVYLGLCAALLPASSTGEQLSATLEPSCVVGLRHKVSNQDGSLQLSARLRTREDGGLLYAEWIAGDGVSAARDLIDSYSTTLRNWTRLVSNDQLDVDDSIAFFPVWMYPVDMKGGAAAGQGSIAVAATLPNEAYSIRTGARFANQGAEYCDTAEARGNVWFEVREWFPLAGARLGRAGLVVTTSVIISTILIISAGLSFDKETRLRLLVTAGPIWWVAMLAFVLAFLVLGGLGAYGLRDVLSDYESGLAVMIREAPQSRGAFILTMLCLAGYICFAIIVTVGHLFIGALLASEVSDRMKESKAAGEQRRQAGGGNGGHEGDADTAQLRGAQGVTTWNPTQRL